MTRPASLRIVLMKPLHIPACNEIVVGSEPWKRLRETIDFRSAVRPNRTGTSAYVCTAGGVIAGFVLFIPEPVFARGGYLRAIGVAPEFRGRGVGRALLAFAEKRTAARSLNLFLCASSFNRAALAFYRKCGYRKAGSLPGLIRPGQTELIFWKRLRKMA